VIPKEALSAKIKGGLGLLTSHCVTNDVEIEGSGVGSVVDQDAVRPDQLS
jgi:hypothetical protein